LQLPVTLRRVNSDTVSMM